MREEFESTMMRGYTYNDGDYVKWLLRKLSDVEFAMGEEEADGVLTEKYDDMLERSDYISGEILSFFPDPVLP
mgnify:CR=1 FL=1